MDYKDKEKKREYYKQYYLAHKNETAEKNAALYLAHKERGECVSCSRPHANNNMRCLLHLDRDRRNERKRKSAPILRERQAEKNRARYYRLKKENRCTRCGIPLNEDNQIGVFCANCRNRIDDY